MTEAADIKGDAKAPQPAGATAAAGLPAHTAFLLDTLPFDRRTRIMDIGANPVNPAPYGALAAAGGAEVHGFEPGKEAFARLEARMSENEVHYPFAVGKGGEVTYHLCRNASFSSLYAPDAGQIDTLGHWENAMSVVDRVPMTALSLDEVEDMAKPDMLRMDTQGAELDILQGGAQALSDAVVIMAKLRFFRLYEGEPMVGRVDQQLREMGFMLHRILPGSAVRLTSSRIGRLRPAMTRNQMVDADAIYVRDLANTRGLSKPQLSHLALLADSVFVSMDLVLRCLDLLVSRRAIKARDIDTYVDKLPANFRVAEA